MSKARNEALAGMTKAELIKTIKALDRKQTQLLNRVAELERTAAEDNTPRQRPFTPPWSLPNAFSGE